MKSERYDAVVIGSGQGGKPLSIALAKAGKRTALIERDHVGGTCINTGCTPTKTMVASARVAYLAARSADYGVHTGPVTVDMAEVRQRKQKVVESFREGSLKGIESTKGLTLIRGEASFTDQHTLSVDLNGGGEGLSISADIIFINTGSRSFVPPVPGLESVPTLDSTSIMELDNLPDHLLVLGGGYIGLEFGQMFRRFGSRVSIVQRADRLLTREDPDVADEVARILEEDGLRLFLKSNVSKVEKSNRDIALSVNSPNGVEQVHGSHLLVATGRIPNSDKLNLAAAGIETDRQGFIRTNDRLETNVPGVYAMGDVKGGPAFTHISYDDFRVIRTNLLEGGSTTIKDRMVPYTVFIDPQLGRVGLSETEATEQGRKIRVARLPMNRVARAIEMDETRGFMKAVIDAENNQILGCAVLGVEGGEMMSMFEIAMIGRLPYTVLKEAIFAHPTLAESLNNLFMAMDG
jgi:pyruvate/2-oxoglutarate dehydrogenase complex dihydrolipoamide dehydrogenase (E3) component